MKKILAPLSVSLFCFTASAAAPLPFGTHYYQVIEAPEITWQDANDAALATFFSGLQGHLVTITSSAEHDFVNSVIVAQGLGEMWAGGYQNPSTETDPKAGWNWINGEGAFPGEDSASPYAFWNIGEPNDYFGPGSEQYLGLNHGPGFNDEGNLELISGYVIEYDPNTISPTTGVPDAGSTAGMLAASVVLIGAASRRFRK